MSVSSWETMCLLQLFCQSVSVSVFMKYENQVRLAIAALDSMDTESFGALGTFFGLYTFKPIQH